MLGPPKNEILSVSRVNTLYRNNSPFKPFHVHTCINACQAFTSPGEMECSFCFNSRYVQGENGEYVVDMHGEKIARRTHQQLPVAPQLASIFTNPNMIKAIISDTYVQDDLSVIKSIFTQSLFTHIKNQNIISGQHDLFLSLYIDGFQTHKRGGTKLTIIMLHILNLPEAERYLYNNVNLIFK